MGVSLLGVCSCYRMRRHVPPGHPVQGGPQREAKALGDPARSPSPGETVKLDSPGWGRGGRQRPDRLLWHQMKGQEWGCWQTDRREGGGVGWGEGR